MRLPTRTGAALLLAATATTAAAAAACSGGNGGGAERPDPRALTGDWAVTLVIGTTEVASDIPQSLLPDRDFDYEEHWRFEACDDTGCTLHRPDGGLLLGDLDGVRLTYDPDRGGLTATVDAAAPVDPVAAGPCEGAATDRWTVTVDVDVHQSVLSGSVLRRAHEERLTAADGSTCFGVGLGLGFSGVPQP